MKVKKPLRTGDKVLYWDGGTLLDLIEVVSVDKKKSQVKLSNGIVLHRKPDANEVYHRADYKEAFEARQQKKRKHKLPVSSAWRYTSGDTERIWNAYLFKKRINGLIKEVVNKVCSTKLEDIIGNQDTIKYIENVESKMKGLING